MVVTLKRDGTLEASYKYAIYNLKKKKKKSPTRYKLTPIIILNYNLLASLKSQNYDFPVHNMHHSQILQVPH